MNKKMKKPILENKKIVMVTAPWRTEGSGELSSWSVDPDWDSMEGIDVNDFLR